MALKEAFSFSVNGHIGRDRLQKICKHITYAAYNTFEDIEATVVFKNQKLILTVRHLKGKPIYRNDKIFIDTNLKKRGLKIEPVKGNSFILHI